MAIPTRAETNHHVGDVLEDIQMGMRAEDFVHVAFMFENLYSRPIEAVIREYSTNAWDSHVFAGIDRPIEVTLPTAERLEFVVQDFGLGMSVDTLRNVYSMYGYSDKRDTNAVAGQLGMGSKSALSYATGFTITAVRNGVKVKALSTKDEHGLGVIKILDTAGTDEPNGVRIAIPVERWDVDSFRSYATNLFQFWEPGTVLVNGEPPAVPDWRGTALMLDDDTWLVRQDQGLRSSYVIMGNVPYPVADADMGRTSARFVARLNIGDVDFAPSREDVRHTRHTDETLAALTEYIRENRKHAIEQAMSAAECRWDETMLKALWMDRNLDIRSDVNSPIWTFNPNSYGNTKARSSFKCRVDHLAAPSLTVVTGFTAKNISTVARERLIEFVTAKGITKPNFVIFPEGAPVGSLDGRPNTYTWDQIIGATEAPKAEKKARQARYETKYSVVGQNPMTADDLSKVKGKVLYIEPGCGVMHGDLDATVVMLRSSNQITRLRRFVPGIEPYGAEVTRRREAAAKAVTAQDKAIKAARTLSDVFKGLNPDDVSDPELARDIRLCNTPDTPTITEADRFGVGIEVKGVSKRYEARYPLLFAGGYYYSLRFVGMESEVLLYINMKHDSIAQAVAS